MKKVWEEEEEEENWIKFVFSDFFFFFVRFRNFEEVFFFFWIVDLCEIIFRKRCFIRVVAEIPSPLKAQLLSVFVC